MPTCKELNDIFRRDCMSVFQNKNKLVITNSIIAKGAEFAQACLDAVIEFEDFDEGNDPHDEHDMVFVTVRNENIIAKIDYYNNEMDAGSEDSCDPSVTVRVMTIMLAEDY